MKKQLLITTFFISIIIGELKLFLTLSSILNIFMNFSIREELDKKDIEEISSKKREELRKKELEDQKIKDQATFG